MKSITRVICRYSIGIILMLYLTRNFAQQLSGCPPFWCNVLKGVDQQSNYNNFKKAYLHFDGVSYIGKWLWGPPFDDLPCDPEFDGYIECFYDDFTGTSLDYEYWDDNGFLHDVTQRASRSSRHRPEEIQVHDGLLHLLLTDVPDWDQKSQPSEPPGKILDDGMTNELKYTHYSGLIQSKQMLPAGKYQLHLKLPQNDDVFPAFWQRWDWGTDDPNDRSKDWNQEVDGFEFYRNGNDGPNPCLHDSYNQLMHVGVPGSNGCGNPFNDGAPGEVIECLLNNFENQCFTADYTWNPLVMTFGINGHDYQHIHKYMGFGGINRLQQCSYYPPGPFYGIFESMPDRFINMPLYINIDAARKVMLGGKKDDGTPFPECTTRGLPLSDDMQVDWFRYSVPINCNEIKTISSYNYSYICIGDDPTSNPSCIAAGRIIVDPAPSTPIQMWSPPADGENNYGIVPYKYGRWLTLIAAEEIEIKPGFEVYEGSHFEAHVRSCNSPYFIASKKEDETETVNNESENINTVYSNYGKSPDNSFFIYPNPATEQLNVYCSSLQPNSFLQVLGADGRLVLQNISMPSFLYSLDVSSLASGVYFLEMFNGGERAVKRFIKQ